MVTLYRKAQDDNMSVSWRTRDTHKFVSETDVFSEEEMV